MRYNFSHAVVTANPELDVQPPVKPEFFAELVSRWEDHVAVFDESFRYVYLNDAAVAVIGRSREDLLGKCIWDLFPSAVGNQFYLELRQVRDTGQSVRSEHYYAPFGKWFENQICRIQNCIVVISRDISTQKATAEKVIIEQSRTRKILDSIGDAFVALGMDGRIQYMNELACKVTGRPAEEALGKSVLDVFPMFKGTAFEHAILQSVRERKPVRVETVGPISKRWHEVMVYPSEDGVSIYSRDIHDQKLTEQALEESNRNLEVVVEKRTASEERLRLALEAGGIGIWDWDILTGKVDWSDRIREIHGLGPGEFGGRLEDFTRLVHPEDLEAVGRQIDDAIRNNAAYRPEMRIVRPSGEVRWIATSAKVLHNPEGKPVRMIGATVDITESKIAKQALEKHAGDLETQVALRTARLRQTVQSLEGVAYTIAHDLRAPLRALNGFASLITEEYASKLDTTGQVYLHSIARSAERMDNLITDLLSYAKLSHSDLPAERVDLTQKLNRVLQDLQAEIETRKPVINIAEPLGVALCNRTVLTQVIANLLVNALKFVRPGQRPEISVWSTMRDGKVRLHIRDNGIGISKEHQDKIFGLFQRLHDHGSYPGTGIGLAIVLKGVERMGGSVGVESALENGSCFWVELPAA